MAAKEDGIWIADKVDTNFNDRKEFNMVEDMYIAMP